MIKDIRGVELNIGDEVCFHSHANIIDTGTIEDIKLHGSVKIGYDSHSWKRYIQKPERQVCLLNKSKNKEL